MPHILGIPHPKQPIVGGLAGKAIDFLANKVKQQTSYTAPQPVQQPFRPTYQQATQVAQNIRPSAPIPQKSTPSPYNLTSPKPGSIVYRGMEKLAKVQPTAQKFINYINPTNPNGLAKVGGDLVMPGEAKVAVPAIFAAGLLSKAQRILPKATAGRVAAAIDGLKNFEKFASRPNTQMQVTTNIMKIGKEVIPDVVNSKEMRKLSISNPQEWRKTVQTFLEDRLTQSKNPQFNLGLSTRNISGGKPPQVPPPNITPAQKIIDALTKAKPLRGQQETIYSAERGTRFAKSQAVREKIGGEAGAIAGRKQLVGEINKVDFESIRPQFNQADIDSLFDQISKHPTLMEGQKTNAIEGLAKLLGERGAGVPTESQIKLLNQIYCQNFAKAIMKNPSIWDKILTNAGDAINLPRAISASMDLSAPLRQGLPLITRGEFWKSLPGMVKSLVSEKSFRGIQSQIASSPYYKAMQDAKLALTEIDGLMPNEDAFISNIAGKIPGIRASNRAYIGFLNKLRADTFTSLAKGLEKEGRLNPDSLKSVADFVNTATGRGNFSAKVGGGANALSEAQKLMNGVFFSPRLIASRLQLLNPQFYLKQDPYVRKEAIKSILGATTAVLSVLGLAKLAGAEVGTDPKNADFAKAKIGNTRYDVTGGFGAYIRIGAQVISGKLISSTTGKETTLGEGYRPLTTQDILIRFFQNKESPVASLLSSMLQGKDPVGQPLEFTSKDPFKNPISKLFIPMLAQDFKDAYDEWGSVPQAAAMSIPSAFGVGTQTYGYQLPEKLKAETEGMTREQRNAFRDQARDVAIARAEGQQVTDTKTQALDDVMIQLKSADALTRTQKLQDLQKNNPQVFKEIIEKYKESYKDTQRELTPIDKELKNSSVNARILYIKNQGKNMSVQDRILFLQSLQKKGILTKEVYSQWKGSPN